ncbi:hypothetical protein [Govanella unica]|uniref:VOC family protein n=1 Tax=Govanella unica TaxID=2975056 RepID=A0A9X3TZD4_9PROT|nr:hypothetical protein [Govania unica]MDA5194242.1 VOC family protein [Govania unica]
MKKLGQIRAVTHAVPSVAMAEVVYTRFLDYRVVDRSAVPASAARSWGAPAMVGRPSITLAPASGEPVFLRFIESPSATDYRALTTHGWNATEILVQDVEMLAAQFAQSPFRIIGPPKGLQRFPMIKAMQVIGPNGECLYFTEVGEGSGLTLPQAQSFVGSVFIVVAGGPDLAAMFDAYAGFTNEIDPPVKTRVQVLSWANDLPPDSEHAHGLIKLGGGTLIELDGYPEKTTARQTPEGELPPGMSIVTFDVDALGDGPWIGPKAPAFLPGDTRQTATFRGAAGELIELIAADAS